MSRFTGKDEECYLYKAGIHFWMLNQWKGPAVRGPRGQMDRDKSAMRGTILDYPNLDVIEGGMEDLLLDEGVGIESLVPLSDPLESMTNEWRRMKESSSTSAQVSNHRARIRGVVITEGAGNNVMEWEDQHRNSLPQMQQQRFVFWAQSAEKRERHPCGAGPTNKNAEERNDI